MHTWAVARVFAAPLAAEPFIGLASESVRLLVARL
jgi:hypothetical protein